MSEHYTKATVEVSEWCKKCHKSTPHRVLGGRLAGCKVCEAQPTKPKSPAAAPPSTQRNLFDKDDKS
jgi:hypothetical protein